MYRRGFNAYQIAIEIKGLNYQSALGIIRWYKTDGIPFEDKQEKVKKYESELIEMAKNIKSKEDLKEYNKRLHLFSKANPNETLYL